MTDSTSEGADEEPLRERIGRLAASRRARIPLALVGVLLLLTSVLIVGHVETREEPNPDVDVSVAIDQTEAVVQTAVRDGAQRAAERAAEQPVTTAADNEWGAVLDATRSNGGSWQIHPQHADNGIADDTFRNYLRALIYLEVQSNFERTGQVVGDVRTNVSLPPIEDADSFEAAVNRVTLREPEKGMLDVTVANVTLAATHDGAVIERRTTTLNVSIATPVFQLHERVRTFQSALEAGVTERGFAQRFNARIYAIGWARGYMQNYQLPIVEVIANRHVEPSVNSAIYRTQQDVFGAADPALENAVRLGWICMAIKDGGAMFDQYMGSNDLSYRNTTTDGGRIAFERDNGTTAEIGLPDGATTAKELCNGAEYLLGDQVTGQHPEAPAVSDLLGSAPGMNENETVGVDETASVPVARMVDSEFKDSFLRAVQRIYTIEGSVSSTSTTTDPLDFDGSANCLFRANRTETYRTAVDRSVTQISIDRVESTDSVYYEAESEVTATVRKKLRCSGESDPTIDTDSFTARISSTVEEAVASPGATIDRINDVDIDPYKYERGADTSLLPSSFRNYAGADRNVTQQIFGREIGTDAHAGWVEDGIPANFTDESSVSRAANSKLTYREVVELDHDEFLDAKLAAAMVADVRAIQRDVADVSHEFSRPDLLKQGADSPFTQLIAKVKANVSRKYLERAYPYRSVGQKAIYESRHAYLRTLVDELEQLEAGHDEAVGTIDDELSELDSGVDNALTFLQQGVSADEPDPIPLTSSHLTDDVTYEVSGSPTYLVDKNLTKADVPAIDANTTFAPLAMKNREYVDIPYDDVIDGIVQRLANVFGLGEPDAEIGFRMAGDVLLAGDLAVAANDTADRFDEPETAIELERDLEAFERNVDDALETFYHEVATETVIELYPSPVAECVVLDPPVAGDADPRRPHVEDSTGVDPCGAIVAEADDDLVNAIEGAAAAIERAAKDGIRKYPTVALKAVNIGSGNATAPIIDNVTAAIDRGQYRYQGFDEHYEAAQWAAVIDSAVRPAVERASAMKVKIGNSEDAEAIDKRLQTALEDVTGEMIRDRLERVGDDVADALSDRTAQWAGAWSGTMKRPARIPAGLPLLPIPGSWYATMNVWDVEVAGEYARFEASANMGTPEHTTATTYVRENRTVRREIAGAMRTLGTVEPISFSGRIHLVVITPPGVGVGDRDDENPECSPTFPVAGELVPAEIQCQEGTYAHDVAWATRRQTDGDETDGE